MYRVVSPSDWRESDYLKGPLEIEFPSYLEVRWNKPEPEVHTLPDGSSVYRVRDSFPEEVSFALRIRDTMRVKRFELNNKYWPDSIKVWKFTIRSLGEIDSSVSKELVVLVYFQNVKRKHSSKPYPWIDSDTVSPPLRYLAELQEKSRKTEAVSTYDYIQMLSGSPHREAQDTVKSVLRIEKLVLP